jgi:hypothetical protein
MSRTVSKLFDGWREAGSVGVLEGETSSNGASISWTAEAGGGILARDRNHGFHTSSDFGGPRDSGRINEDCEEALTVH